MPNITIASLCSVLRVMYTCFALVCVLCAEFELYSSEPNQFVSYSFVFVSSSFKLFCRYDFRLSKHTPTNSNVDTREVYNWKMRKMHFNKIIYFNKSHFFLLFIKNLNFIEMSLNVFKFISLKYFVS